jgi:hypothetical protein
MRIGQIHSGKGAVDNSAWLGKAPLLLTDQTDDRPSFSQLAVPFVIIVTIPVDGEALYKIVGPIPVSLLLTSIPNHVHR